MKKSKKITRRQFVGTTAAVSIASLKKGKPVVIHKPIAIRQGKELLTKYLD